MTLWIYSVINKKSIIENTLKHRAFFQLLSSSSSSSDSPMLLIAKFPSLFESCFEWSRDKCFEAGITSYHEARLSAGTFEPLSFFECQKCTPSFFGIIMNRDIDESGGLGFLEGDRFIRFLLNLGDCTKTSVLGQCRLAVGGPIGFTIPGFSTRVALMVDSLVGEGSLGSRDDAGGGGASFLWYFPALDCFWCESFDSSIFCVTKDFFDSFISNSSIRVLSDFSGAVSWFVGWFRSGLYCSVSWNSSSLDDSNSSGRFDPFASSAFTTSFKIVFRTWIPTLMPHWYDIIRELVSWLIKLL